MKNNKEFNFPRTFPQERTFQDPIGLIGKRHPFPSDFWLTSRKSPIDSKVIFLNKENLDKIEGYKAEVEYRYGVRDKREIHIILTGFSRKSALALFNKLKSLPAEEIYGE